MSVDLDDFFLICLPKTKIESDIFSENFYQFIGRWFENQGRF